MLPVTIYSRYGKRHSEVFILSRSELSGQQASASAS